MFVSRVPLAALLIASSAAAAPGRRVTIDVPPAAISAGPISHTIVLERCTGNCTVNNGGTNAMAMTSSIPQGTGPFTLHEFKDSMGQTGTAADAEWNAIVTCVREVYSPFDVTVTDTRPVGGTTYHLAIVAGVPQEAGLPADILGIAPLAGDCSAQDNVVSFSFANTHPTTSRVLNICWTVAQESAHAFGLDHEFMFFDGKSSCSDPMTYRMDCGGQRFFRNKGAQCGEFAAKPACKCTPSQNSHAKLLDVFGPGTPITPPPTSVITFPQPDATVLGASVAARAGSQRGITKVELLINGFVWATVPGAAIGGTGQPNPGDYQISVPAAVPKSIVDLVVRATDDLGASTDSAQITVTNGAPCTDASVCAEFQRCETGRCLWDPPVGELGDECKYTEFCKSNLCVDTSAGKLCSEPCEPGSDSCPMDLACVQASPGAGVCLPKGDAGCCETGTGGASPWIHGGFALLVIGLVGRRRRSGSRMVGRCQRSSPGA